MPKNLFSAIIVVPDEAGTPLTQHEITRRILERKLWTTNGKTADATVGAKLYVNIKTCGSESIFQLAGKNLFALRAWGLPEYISNNQKSDSHRLERAKSANRHPRQPQAPKHNRKPVIPSQDYTYSVLSRELDALRTFLEGRSDHRHTDERICDWIQFCYTLELYSEASDLFKLADANSVHPWYFERTRKVARICELRTKNPS